MASYRPDENRLLIETAPDTLSITRQCELVEPSRSSWYYAKQPAVSEADKFLMDRLDEIHTDFYLLRGVKAQHPNHIWGTDITYVRALGWMAAALSGITS